MTTHERMLEVIDDDYDKSEGNFIWDATKAAAIEFDHQKSEISRVEKKQNVNNLRDEELERFVFQRTGQERKPGTHAITEVIISGSVGSNIEVGDIVGSDTIDYLSLENKTIEESGKMTVLVEAEEVGAIGNLPAGAIDHFPSSISGLVDVYNPNPITNGYDAENDDSLRQRYYDKLQRPGKAGNKYHYEEWAKEVVGVGDVRVVPRYNGPLSVKVIIIDSNKQPADEELIDDIRTHIESEMPFGVTDLAVVSAEGAPINIKANLTLNGDYVEEIAIDNIKENITMYLKEIAFKTNFISYARIGSEIINAEGVIDYEDLIVNDGIANIPINDDEVAVIGGVVNE